jgi:HK97 family phage major capsid protein
MKMQMVKELKMGEDTYAIGDLVEVEDTKAADKLITDGVAKEFIEVKKIEKPTKKVEKAIEVVEKEEKHMDISTKTREQKTFGELLGMVIKGEQIDPDITISQKSIDGLNMISKASVGQNVATAGDGGNTTQNDFMFEIQKLARAKSAIWSKVRQIECTGTGLKFPQANETTRIHTSLYSGVRGYKVSEGVDHTISKLAFTNKDLTLAKLGLLVGATDEILDDNYLMEQFVVNAAIDAMAWIVDREIINAPLSVISNPLVNSTTGVACTGSNPATYAQLVNMYTAIEPTVRSQAQWYFSNDTYIDLLSTADAANRLVFNPGVNGSISASVPGTLFGLPVNVIEQLPAAGAGAGNIICTVPSKYILAVKAGGVKMSMSDQVYWLSDQSLFKFVFRMNGAPEQASKVTLVDSTVVSNTSYISA